MRRIDISCSCLDGSYRKRMDNFAGAKILSAIYSSVYKGLIIIPMFALNRSQAVRVPYFNPLLLRLLLRLETISLASNPLPKSRPTQNVIKTNDMKVDRLVLKVW